MGTNWVLENLLKALATWTEKMQEIWTLLTTSPQEFRGGTIWSIIANIHGGMKSIAYALLVLFFVIGVARTTTNFSELKRPEQALKLFLRFAIAKGAVTYSMDILLAIFSIAQGIILRIAGNVGNVLTQGVTLPDVIQQKMPNGKTYTYIVEQTEILDSDDDLRIPIIEGKHLILVTCYPFYYSGHAPKQFVVLCSLAGISS